MNATEEQEHLAAIAALSHFEMCRLWRFAEVGHPYFDSSTSCGQAFKDRLFKHFGGFTPEISKALS